MSDDNKKLEHGDFFKPSEETIAKFKEEEAHLYTLRTLSITAKEANAAAWKALYEEFPIVERQAAGGVGLIAYFDEKTNLVRVVDPTVTTEEDEELMNAKEGENRE